MGRMYSAEFSKVAVTLDQDFFEITPADEKPIAIHAIYLSQSSDLADAAEEILNIKVIRGHATSGSVGGTNSTPAVLNPLDTASGATVEINNTTIASTGTAVDLHSDSFNIRAGLQLIFDPDMRPKCSLSNGIRLVVRLMEDTADELTMSGTVYFEELA